MYRHNIYTRPSLIGFGNYQGLGVTKMVATKSVVPVTPKPTGLDALPTWAYIAIPVGAVAIAAIVYYKFF